MPDGEYGEVHHIVPKSEGGSDEPDNLVKLTAREHYVAHLLLARIYNDASMWAAIMMMSSCKGKKRQYRVSSRLYQNARSSFAEHHSKVMKQIANTPWFRSLMSNAHKGKPPHNEGKPCSEEQKEKLRQANLGKKQSEETKRKRNAKLKGHPSFNAGMKWWNNGNEERMCRECPEGWVAGRLKKKKEVD